MYVLLGLFWFRELAALVVLPADFNDFDLEEFAAFVLRALLITFLDIISLRFAAILA